MLKLIFLPLTLTLWALVALLRLVQATLWILAIPGRIVFAIFGPPRRYRARSVMPRQYIVSTNRGSRWYSVRRM